MAKGAPNGEDLKLNYVVKVWDQVAEKYRPIYIAPDSTDEVRGDVYLTDTPNEEDTAALGVTAISPKGVYDVQQNLQQQITNNSETVENYLPPLGTVYRTTSEEVNPENIWGGGWTREGDRHDLQGFWIWTRTS